MYPALNHELLHSILRVESCSGDTHMMEDFIYKTVEQMGIEPACDEVGNIYATKGDAETYPCIVCHTDTVHAVTGDGIVPIIYGSRITGLNPVTMEQTGIGGDDKCGIYAALHCLTSLPACKVAFMVDEEVGCIGASLCDMSFFDDCRYILEADRRGHEDFVTDISGPISSEDFQDAVSNLLVKHKFKHVNGAMTDVMELRDRNVGISCANISAGYYNPHQDSEFIDTNSLQKTCNLMVDICKKLKAKFPHKHERPSLKLKKHFGGLGKWESFPSWPDHETDPSWIGRY